MRIALVWNASVRLVEMSVRYERYVRGFRQLGHEAFAVCLASSAVGFTEPTVTVSKLDVFLDKNFWSSLRLGAAVVITWLGMPELLATLRQACPYVVSVADSDGLIGARVHPRTVLRRMLAIHRGWFMKLRAAKYWLQLYLYLAPTDDRPLIASAEQADLIALCSPRAQEHFGQFLMYHRRADLQRKVAVISYPIDECYLTGSVLANRDNRVVAIGRWDDPQKDAQLLRRAISGYLDRGGRTEFCLIGPRGTGWFEPLTRLYHQVRYLGSQPREAIVEHLRRSRALLLSSRWESGPIVLNEALASGCSVIGTDSIPSVVSVCESGPYGTVAFGRNPRDLANAIRDEMKQWDNGHRNPAAIAAFWRPHFDPVQVCRQMLP